MASGASSLLASHARCRTMQHMMTPDDLEKHKAIFEWLKTLNTLSVGLLGLGAFFARAQISSSKTLQSAVIFLLFSILLGLYAHSLYIYHFDENVPEYFPIWDSWMLKGSGYSFAIAIFLLVLFTICKGG